MIILILLIDLSIANGLPVILIFASTTYITEALLHVTMHLPKQLHFPSYYDNIAIPDQAIHPI